MRRREFITLVGSAAATSSLLWPLAARAEEAGKLPTIGFLGQSTRSASSEWVAAFVQRLRELGWIEGRTVAIDYRWGGKEAASVPPRSRVRAPPSMASSTAAGSPLSEASTSRS